jgi:hypothetical protein
VDEARDLNGDTLNDLKRLIYRTGKKPVSAALAESVLSRQLDGLEPTLTRHGYRVKDLVEAFDAKPSEIKALFITRENWNRPRVRATGCRQLGCPSGFRQLQLMRADGDGDGMQARPADCKHSCR